MATSVELKIIPFLDPRKLDRQAARWAEEIGDRASKALTGALADTQKKVEENYIQTIRDALRLGRDADAKRIRTEFKQRERAIRVQAGQLKRIEEEISELREKGATDAEVRAAEVRKKALEDDIADRQDALEDLIKTQERAQEKLVKQLDEGLEQAGKDFGESLEGAAGKFEDLFAKALSADNLDPSELVKGLGSAIQGAAPTLLAGGGKMAAQGGAVGALGKAAVSLGAAAGLLAGVAGAIGAVVAVLFAAYNQTKAFNKSILEGSSALDLLGSEGTDSAGLLNYELGKVRQAAQQVAWEFRSTSEEVIALSSAMNDAGLTFREQKRLFGSYEESMRTALIATQTFGIGASEAAEIIDVMSRDLGLTQEGIESGFMDIFAAAQLSGMGVKNFFTSISEATSGLALYNFRLEDTLELLLMMEKTLGEDMAKTVMGGLRGKYGEMGFTDRMQKVMQSGAAGRDVLRATADRLGDEFAARLGAAGGTLGVSTGLLTETGELNREFIKGLRGTELGAVQNQLSEAGLDSLARQLARIAQLERGAGPGATLGQRAAALSGLDEASTLAMDMVQAFAVLGDRTIGQMEGLDRAAFEQMTGVSGSMFDAYTEIANRLGATLQEELGRQPTMREIADAIASGDLLSPEDQKRLEEAQEKGLGPMEQIAKNQLKETESIFNTLKNMIVPLLEGIYRLSGGTEDPDVLYRRATLKDKGFDKLSDTEKVKLGLYVGGGQGAMAVDPAESAEHTQKVLEYLATKESGEEDKRSKDQIKATVEAGKDFLEAAQQRERATLARYLPEGFDAMGASPDAIARALKADGLTGDEKAAFLRAFPELGDKLDDFIYRGSPGGGQIMPINTSDDFYGAKPGGAIDKALRGGVGGVTINNLTINESGNPQKTLEMVKQAIRAAKYA